MENNEVNPSERVMFAMKLWLQIIQFNLSILYSKDSDTNCIIPLYYIHIITS